MSKDAKRKLAQATATLQTGDSLYFSEIDLGDPATFGLPAFSPGKCQMDACIAYKKRMVKRSQLAVQIEFMRAEMHRLEELLKNWPPHCYNY